LAERGARRFSQAISEGDGISVVVEVDGVDAARIAAAEGAEAIVVRAGHGLREAVELPVLWVGGESVDEAANAGADACVVVAAELADEDGVRLDDAVARASELGIDCVVSVADDEELLRVLERHEPDIFLLGGGFDGALALLADVPVGKLAIAWASFVTREQVLELERAGVDAVIVPAGNVAELVGDAPPQWPDRP
jgi:hypothetical protein